jgi:hypothetical protein
MTLEVIVALAALALQFVSVILMIQPKKPTRDKRTGFFQLEIGKIKLTRRTSRDRQG